MEMSLNNREWREFFLKDIFTEIQRGKRLKKDDHKVGKIPYVSSTAINNGVDCFIGNREKVRTFSDCLTLANSGSVGATFYQSCSFVASDHVTKLQNKSYNKYIYLFISLISKRLSEKYGFNREINDKRIQKEKILLPITIQGSPDFVFMEQFMRSIEQEKLKQYDSYIQKKLSKLKNYKEVTPLKEKEWAEFEIGKLFKLQAGKSKGLNHLKKEPNGINYLGATKNNNGVLCQVEIEEKMIQEGNCIAFIRNGEGSMGYSIYKKEKFISTSDISVGYSDFLNEYTGLFITTVSDKIRGKYNDKARKIKFSF